MLVITGGQLRHHTISLWIGYQWACKTTEYSTNISITCLYSVWLMYSRWMLYLHTRNLPEIVSRLNYVSWFSLNVVLYVSCFLSSSEDKVLVPDLATSYISIVDGAYYGVPYMVLWIVSFCIHLPNWCEYIKRVADHPTSIYIVCVMVAMRYVCGVIRKK